MLKISSKIIVPIKDPRIRMAIDVALAPDNASTPPGIEVKSYLKGKNLEIEILVSDDSGRFLHAFNDLIRCLIAIDNSISLLSQIKKKSVGAHASTKKSCQR